MGDTREIHMVMQSVVAASKGEGHGATFTVTPPAALASGGVDVTDTSAGRHVARAARSAYRATP